MFVEIEQDDAKFSKRCKVTGEFYEVRVPLDQFYNWQATLSHIQVAFPTLSPEEREFILSGTTPAEWDKMFPEVD